MRFPSTIRYTFQTIAMKFAWKKKGDFFANLVAWILCSIYTQIGWLQGWKKVKQKIGNLNVVESKSHESPHQQI